MTTDPERAAIAALDEMERLYPIATERDPVDWVAGLAAAEKLDVLRCEHAPALLSLARRTEQAEAEVERLRDALDSAARTAHMHNKAFCFGTFEECSNCTKWRAALRPDDANKGGGA